MSDINYSREHAGPAGFDGEYDSTVLPEQRFTRKHPCVICNGGNDDLQGQSIRCWGYISKDGLYAHCARPEFALNGLPFNEKDQTYAHKLGGKCKCGEQHAFDPTWPPKKEVHRLPSDFDPFNLPKVYEGGLLPIVTSAALDGLAESNEPPVVFVRGIQLVRIIEDEKERPIIDIYSKDSFMGRLARCAVFIHRTKDAEIPVDPPKRVVADILALKKWPLEKFPPLESIVESAILRPDGTILSTPGYDIATRLFYHPSRDFIMPSIPDSPSVEERAAALALLEETIGEFPYVEQADRANALGLLLTPIVRPAIRGCVPLALIDAPAPGTGKGLLASVVSGIASGRAGEGVAIITEGQNDEEWRKRITAMLLTGPSVIAIDNLEERLAAPSLSAVLTTHTWKDRILGTNETAVVPNNATWLATGNNIRLGGDIPRRCYRIRMDAKVARPWTRTKFKHPKLLEWVGDHRGELLAALLTLARAWYVAGRPEADVPTLGGFEEWARIIGGILAFAGVSGFLGNLEELWEQADETIGEWETFLRAWRQLFDDHSTGTGEIVQALDPQTGYTSLRDALPGEFAEDLKNSGRLARRLGRAFSAKRDRRFAEDGLRLEHAGEDKHRGAILWRVVTDLDKSTLFSKEPSTQNEPLDTTITLEKLLDVIGVSD